MKAEHLLSDLTYYIIERARKDGLLEGDAKEKEGNG